MTLRVIGDKVLIEQVTLDDPVDDITELRKGKVVSVGNGRVLDSAVIAVGRFVLYSKHDAIEIPYEGTDYILLWADDILIVSDT